MTLEQKIAQLHRAMETTDIWALTVQSAQSGTWTNWPQTRVERHLTAIDELGIPRFRSVRRRGLERGAGCA